MQLKIKKLTPDLAEDYVHFFDVTPHDNQVEENKCYCVTWRSDESYARNPNHWFDTREERRRHATEFVQDGSIQGYLAFVGEEIVGWCNANADCNLGLGYLRAFWDIEQPAAGQRIKSVFCFVIAPHMQRKGVATQLLQRVCQDAAAEGFDFVQAYVYEDPNAVPHDFRGPLAMYLGCGFSIHSRRDGRAVVRKPLK